MGIENRTLEVKQDLRALSDRKPNYEVKWLRCYKLSKKLY